MKEFFEKMFFTPRWYHFPLIVLLSPVSLLYGFVMLVRRVVTKRRKFGIPIISVGNLIVGGSGKTPFVMALAYRLKNVCIISRGYGRLCRGMIEVSRNGKVLVGVEDSGDEAMLMAQCLPNASVIVSEDRHQAIELAKQRGAKVLILDDGFNRVEIEKYEIILEPSEIKNYLPFPSGAFREFWFCSKAADVVVKEGRDFERVVEVKNPTKRMVLVTAISNPQRLDKYLPQNIVAKVTYDDHMYFKEVVLLDLLKEHQADSILCTSKDKVKMQGFKLAISEMKLKLEIQDEIFKKIDTYIENY